MHLKDLYSNVIGNRALIASLTSRAEQGLQQALEATLDTLCAVYELQAPGWDELKQKVEVSEKKFSPCMQKVVQVTELFVIVRYNEGFDARFQVSFVKKTSTTNTSLTSGIATRLLHPNQTVGHLINKQQMRMYCNIGGIARVLTVGLLNCGTGAVKFQFYQMDRWDIRRMGVRREGICVLSTFFCLVYVCLFVFCFSLCCRCCLFCFCFLLVFVFVFFSVVVGWFVCCF